MLVGRAQRWTNASARLLAEGGDPVEAVKKKARNIVCEVMDSGWTGPPFNPLGIADHLKLRVIPKDDVRDARTVPLNEGKFQIEFNPTLPRARMRYSLAHEIAHTLFPDAGKQVRYRAERTSLSGDEWQLEALCNIAAAEFLMPIGTLPPFGSADIDVDRLMKLRKSFDVSTEALFIRAVEVTGEPCAMFCASLQERGRRKGGYRLDYVIGSRAWNAAVPRGSVLEKNSLISGCSAIGYTAKGDERWGELDVHVECVGIPPYPHSSHPRVVGIITSFTDSQPVAITYVLGNATKPLGHGKRLIVQVVNNRARSWGGHGFAQALRRTWPAAHEDYKKWVATEPGTLRLGNMHVTWVEDDVAVASMVAQRGYPTADTQARRPLIQYAALRTALEKVADQAARDGMSVHMPLIGCGQAGGDWSVVSELVLTTLCGSGVPVTVYELPGEERPATTPTLFEWVRTRGA